MRGTARRFFTLAPCAAAAATLVLTFAHTAGAQPAPGRTPGGLTPGTLDNPERIEIIQGNLTVFFDLNLIRRNPAVLNDPGIMRYFVFMNNCTYNTSRDASNDEFVRQAARNELRYPELVEFYKPKVAELLRSVPVATTVTIAEVEMGDYDTARKAFPLVTLRGPSGKPRRVDLFKQSPILATTIPNIGNGTGTCTDAMTTRIMAQKNTRPLGDVYVFDMDKGLSFNEVPMDLDAARKYLDSTPGNRTVRIDAELELLDSTQPIVDRNRPDTAGDGSLRSNSRLTSVEFPAKLKTVKVIKPSNARQIGWGKITPNQVLAILYP